MLTNEQLQEAMDAYYAAGQNKARAAELLQLPRQTYHDRLAAAEKRLGVAADQVAHGKVDAPEPTVMKLPMKGQVQRYILTSAQNNTPIHPGFKNLLALKDYYKAALFVGTYTYQLNVYSAVPAKVGSEKDDGGLWYAPELAPFIVDSSVELAPGLVWCGEQNIIPTARHPLISMEDYNGRKSNVVPHAKIAMESVASMANEAVKFNYTTGTITQRNYIQKRAGILAEQKHSYGALLVEVDSEGNWFARQLHIAGDHSIMDVGPGNSDNGQHGVVAINGEVREQLVTSSIYWGDVHASEANVLIKHISWGKGGMIDWLKPDTQYMGDVFSMRSRNHHELRDFHSTYRKHQAQQETVEAEINQTADFLTYAQRPFCKTVIVPSNHDRHLDRWLNEADFRADPLNARYFCFLQHRYLSAIDYNEEGFNILEFALQNAGLNKEVEFLQLDESSLDMGIENGLHGDLGPNGSRGSTKAFTKFGRAINKGHDHTAAIRDQVYSAGACSLRFSYMKGPSSHSASHIVTYKNGTRAIITIWGSKWRA